MTRKEYEELNVFSVLSDTPPTAETAPAAPEKHPVGPEAEERIVAIPPAHLRPGAGKVGGRGLTSGSALTQGFLELEAKKRGMTVGRVVGEMYREQMEKEQKTLLTLQTHLTKTRKPHIGEREAERLGRYLKVPADFFLIEPKDVTKMRVERELAKVEQQLAKIEAKLARDTASPS